MKTEKTNTITIDDQRLVVSKREEQPHRLPEDVFKSDGTPDASIVNNFYTKTALDITLISAAEDRVIGSLELTPAFAQALSDALEELL